MTESGVAVTLLNTIGQNHDRARNWASESAEARECRLVRERARRRKCPASETAEEWEMRLFQCRAWGMPCKGQSDQWHSSSKCSIIQLLERYKQQLACKLLVQNGDEFLTLSGFGQVIADIAECPDFADISAEKLLFARPFTVVYSSDKIITGIVHPN